jgi:hypothetical protein
LPALSDLSWDQRQIYPKISPGGLTSHQVIQHN